MGRDGMDFRSFRQNIGDLQRQITDKMTEIFHPCSEKYGLTYVQYLILLEIDAAGEHTVGELGRRVNMDSGNISSMCKKLEKNGYVMRKRSEKDERVVKISLTGPGKACVDDVNHILDDKYGAFLKEDFRDGMSEIVSGLQMLNQLLSKVLSHEEDGNGK